jgi:hypothetical protein
MNDPGMSRKRILLILAHVGLGFVLFAIPQITKYCILIFTSYGLIKIISKKNQGYNTAHLYAAYIIGFEILLRMTKSVIIYEYGKLAIVILFFIGIIVEKLKRETPSVILIYIACLCPAILLTIHASLEGTNFKSGFELLTYNLSGPIALTVSVFYFYKRKMSLSEFREISYWMILPLFTMLIYIVLKARSYTEIVFDYSANTFESGGFGPNQVSTILGLGIFLIGFSFVFSYKLTFSRYLDLIMVIIFFYRGLLTFSRGGIISPIISIVLMLLIISTYFPKRIFNGRMLGIVIISGIVGFYSFVRANEKSGGFLEERYQGNTLGTKYTGQKVLWDGRDKLLSGDLIVFLENPILGVGPGLAQIRRSQITGFSAASHTEFSRMLSEHGIFGIFALCILIWLPIKEFKRLKSYYNKAILVGCTSFAFLSMSHSGMRTACPSFIFGLAFINIVSPFKRKKPKASGIVDFNVEKTMIGEGNASEEVVSKSNIPV